MTELRNRPIVVVAMGGHAFIGEGERGTYPEHARNAADICAHLMSLVSRHYNLVVTHGNGPQVGNLLLATELVRGQLPDQPLDALVAQTEGSLGYLMQQALLNHLRRREIKRFVVTMVTQVLVDPADPAWKRPAKPVGPFYARDEAEARRASHGWEIMEDAGRGWRRVVPSPRPQRVVQRNMIRDAVLAGHIVIACGGGGIPIIKDANDDYIGVEAVIDKDLTASLLARDIGAELLVILTAVPQVYLEYKTPRQRALGAVTLEELDRYIAEGHFAPGSMGPKIEAVREFLAGGGRRGLITDPAHLEAALDGKAGTHFVGRI